MIAGDRSRPVKAILGLADGATFIGESFGAEGEAAGEVVFNTSITGYQEILTDPSYRGQLIAMTFPEIGNVGVNREDEESRSLFLGGFIVKEYRSAPSNWRAQESLGAYMQRHGIVGICGIDTRALVRHVRDHGAQEGVISTVDNNPADVVAKARAAPGLIGRDLVREVTCENPYEWAEGTWNQGAGCRRHGDEARSSGFLVVAYDYGIKRNILRSLVDSGCRVHVVPAGTPAADVLRLGPDGVFLSNGPGDPAGVPYARENVERLLGKVPIFGICLGHQILALALRARTYKLDFGHHGANHPVRDVSTGRVEITAQNHGFAVAAESVREGMIITHVNLNDQTVEGLRHEGEAVFSVQYHPEASPGPRDARYLFGRFVELMGRRN